MIQSPQTLRKKKYKFFLKSKSDFLYSDLVIKKIKIKNLQYKKRQVANFFFKEFIFTLVEVDVFLKKKIWKKS